MSVSNLDAEKSVRTPHEEFLAATFLGIIGVWKTLALLLILTR